MDKKDLKEIRGVVQEVVSEEINKFALVVGRSFDGVEARLEEHDKKFVDIDNRFEKIENILDEHSHKFMYLNQKIDQNHREVMDGLKKIQKTSDEDVEALGLDVMKLDKRVTKLEKSAA